MCKQPPPTHTHTLAPVQHRDYSLSRAVRYIANVSLSLYQHVQAERYKVCLICTKYCTTRACLACQYVVGTSEIHPRPRRKESGSRGLNIERQFKSHRITFKPDMMWGPRDGNCFIQVWIEVNISSRITQSDSILLQAGNVKR